MFKRRDSIIAKLLFKLLALFILSIPTTAQIDNCCHIDRRCETNEEWINGYYAFQNSICATDSQQQQQETPSVINNCCYTGWSCATNAQWIGGYYAFQRDQCESSQSDWQSQWRQRSNSNGAGGSSNRDEASSQERISVYLDLTEDDETVNENDDGPTIIIRRITPLQMCRLFPGLVWCEEMFPELYRD